MRETEEVLIELGLTKTEAAIYLAGLKADSVSVPDIAKKTRIKRPTIYHALATLGEKGLVAERRTGGKVRYAMCEPRMLHELIEDEKAALASRAQKLEALIPLLAVQREKDNDAITIAEYTGIEGMKMVMDVAFYCTSKRWDIIAPYKNFLREYDPEYARRYLEARKRYGITSRTLWEIQSPGVGRDLTKEEQRDRNPRFMPVEMRDRFKSMMILFDDKVAIFSSYEKMTAILITSKELHEMFRAMFDSLWEASEAY